MQRRAPMLTASIHWNARRQQRAHGFRAMTRRKFRQQMFILLWIFRCACERLREIRRIRCDAAAEEAIERRCLRVCAAPLEQRRRFRLSASQCQRMRSAVIVRSSRATSCPDCHAIVMRPRVDGSSAWPCRDSA